MAKPAQKWPEIGLAVMEAKKQGADGLSGSGCRGQPLHAVAACRDPVRPLTSPPAACQALPMTSKGEEGRLREA